MKTLDSIRIFQAINVIYRPDYFVYDYGGLISIYIFYRCLFKCLIAEIVIKICRFFLRTCWALPANQYPVILMPPSFPFPHLNPHLLMQIAKCNLKSSYATKKNMTHWRHRITCEVIYLTIPGSGLSVIYLYKTFMLYFYQNNLSKLSFKLV